MEQSMVKSGRRAGWSQRETDLLWETADEAQQQGLPLKAVFERIASQTGRRPNSIRNYYYAQAQKREGALNRPARFVPFTEPEVRTLVKTVLTERTKGHSVRSCLSRLAGGDHSLMLRYQNKYRSVLKTRPELVEEIVETLRAEGLDAVTPQVNHRPRVTLEEACRNLGEGARRQDDPELIRACEVLTRALFTPRPDAQARGNHAVRMDLYRMALEDKQRSLSLLAESAQGLVDAVKDFLGLPESGRAKELPTHCAVLSERIGLLEQRIQELSSK